MNLRLSLALAFSIAHIPSLCAQAAWTRLYPSGTLPAARVGHAMARDTVAGRLCMFGGQIGNNVTDEFWQFDGTAWTPLTAARPTARSNHAMAFDERRGRVVMFGGSGGSGFLDETWEWDGTSWSQRLFAVKPPARWLTAMAYDPVHQRILLFGGSNGGNFSDTWEYDGALWTQRLPVTHPGPREGAGVAYDPSTGHMLLFGGANGGLFDETWSWDGSAWTQETPNTPPFARATLAIVTDTARARVVLFAGDPTDPRAWEWNGSQWSATNALGPAARAQTAMAYDPAQRQVVLFSGTGYIQDTWAWRTPLPATVATYGSGCGGSAGVPVLANAPYSLPWLGDTARTRVSSLAPNCAGGLFATGTNPSGALSLAGYGMPGCALVVFAPILEFRPAAAGTVDWSLAVPNSGSLLGAHLYQQAFPLDPGANALGMTASNGVVMTAGLR